MNPSAGPGQKAPSRGVIWGVLTMAFGLLAIAMLVGIALLAGGLSMTVFAFQAQSLGRGILKFLFGGLTVLAGIAALAQPGVALINLTLLLGFYFFLDGLVTLVVAWNVKPEPGWGWLTFSGGVTVLLAWMILRGWPLSGVWAIGVLVGVRMLFSGASMLLLGSAEAKSRAPTAG